MSNNKITFTEWTNLDGKTYEVLELPTGHPWSDGEEIRGPGFRLDGFLGSGRWMHLYRGDRDAIVAASEQAIREYEEIKTMLGDPR